MTGVVYIQYYVTLSIEVHVVLTRESAPLPTGVATPPLRY